MLKPTEWADPAKMAATHGAGVGMSDYPHSYMLESVLELAGSAEMIKRALAMEAGPAENGKFSRSSASETGGFAPTSAENFSGISPLDNACESSSRSG